MQHEKTISPSPAEKLQNDPIGTDAVVSLIAADNAAQDTEIATVVAAALTAADVAAGLLVYADNAAAVTAGLAVGRRYRTGDILKIVHV